MDDPVSSGGQAPRAILTLEPLLEIVRTTVEDGGWLLSGLQKTTSYEYAGRWDGDSTRSAYAFYHRGGDEQAVESVPDPTRQSPRAAEWDPALDVFLDETSRGLTGTLALVLPGPELAGLGDAEVALNRLSRIATDCIPPDLVMPVSLRARLPDARRPAGSADVEIRFKVRIGAAAIRAGSRVVEAVVRSGLTAFDRIDGHPDMGALLSPS